MRVVKAANERKNEILDVAHELFVSKGFDGTSTNDILQAAGIARGTLYYHFKSKEDVMDALIERYNLQLLQSAQAIADDKTMPIYERMLKAVLALKPAEGSKELFEHIHKPQNALMHSKVQRAIVNGLTPVLAGIVNEGMDQGLFDTPSPYESMEMLVVYATTIFDGDIIELTPEQSMSRVQAFITNMERILGVESGKLSFVIQMFSGLEVNSHE